MQNGKQILIIPGKLPGLNDIPDAKASFRQRGWKKRVTTYWVLKKEWSEKGWKKEMFKAGAIFYDVFGVPPNRREQVCGRSQAMAGSVSRLVNPAI